VAISSSESVIPIPPMYSTRIVIPTYNAEPFLLVSLPLLTAVLPPSHILLIDSSSQDRTAEVAKEFGVHFHSIEQSTFNHGNTRNLARYLIDDLTDILVYMTQDAIPVNERFLEELLHPFADPEVGMVYGRQMPVPGAPPLEAFPRLFNYPAHSMVKSQVDLPTMGIKTFFCSDSFCAYRSTAWDRVGGFPKDVIIGEDQHIAARMIQGGHKIAYAAAAQVYHSHSYTISQEFQRYFDTGAFFSQQRWILDLAGRAEGEGLRFVRAQTIYLWKIGKVHLVPYSLLLTIVKYLGYRVGLLEAHIPMDWKIRCSQQKYFWRGQSQNTL
jgi:rhamnosyltransferase